MEQETDRILVVDDEPIVCEFLKDILEQNGYTVDSAHSAAEAMQKLTAHEYRAAVLDYMMPGADGRVLYKNLRIMRPDLANRVLLITAAPPEEPLINFLTRNKLRFLRKPFEPDELVYAVRALHQPST